MESKSEIFQKFLTGLGSIQLYCFCVVGPYLLSIWVLDDASSSVFADHRALMLKAFALSWAAWWPMWKALESIENGAREDGYEKGYKDGFNKLPHRG